jgi:hypothetical protein
MWLAIKNIFRRTSVLNKLAARRRFYTVSLADGDRIFKYINRVKQLTEELKAMDVTIVVEEVAMAVLNRLPPNYDTLIGLLDTMGDHAKLTLEFTKSRLIQEEQRSDVRELRNPSKVRTKDAALVGSSSEKSVGHTRDRGDNMCSRCNRPPGHVARYCRSKAYFGSGKSGFVIKKVGDTAQIVKEGNSGDKKDPVCLVG